MQTLIIIAILVLAATTAAALLYAILRDSTGRIAGGSETFDGLPSGPQNLQVESVLSGADVDLTISWEAPSYLGEFPPTGYELSINKDGTSEITLDEDIDYDNDGTDDCDSPLETSNENFTYDNTCRVTVSSVVDASDYELLFTINLGSADASYSPGGLTFYRELDLSTMPAPPSQVNAVSLPNALAVSWEAESNITYRLYIDIDGDDMHDTTDYYQCFNSRSEEVTREIPNIAGRDGYQGTATLQKGQQYTVRLSAASTALTLDATRCSDDDNFGREVSFTGSFGLPSAPEITLETDLTRRAGTETLPSLKATLASCDADSSTTIFWQVAGQPQMSHTIQGCGTAGCTVNCALTVYENFELDTEYEVWAVAENAVGASSPSERQGWLPTRASVSSSPGPPRNINTFTEADGILVSWDTPGFVPDAGIRGYIFRSQEKPSGAACPATPSDELEISADIVQYKFRTQEQYKIYCFQLSAFSIDSSQTELESKKEDFEAVYVYVNPLYIGTDEFLLNWHPDPRAEYYTISWAPLTSDKACDTTDAVNDPSIQPPNFLSATIPYNGEETLTYTIPAIRNTYYLLRSTATLNNGANVSWQRYVCTNLYNAPSVAAPAWTGNQMAGTAIGIRWTKPDETAADFDKRHAPYSYALRVTHTAGGSTTTEHRCIPFGDASLTEDPAFPNTVSRSFTSTSVAGVYAFSLTVVPTAECSSDADAESIITSPPAATPPVRTGSRTVA